MSCPTYFININGRCTTASGDTSSCGMECHRESCEKNPYNGTFVYENNNYFCDTISENVEAIRLRHLWRQDQEEMGER